MVNVKRRNSPVVECVSLGNHTVWCSLLDCFFLEKELLAFLDSEFPHWGTTSIITEFKYDLKAMKDIPGHVEAPVCQEIDLAWRTAGRAQLGRSSSVCVL